MIHVLATLIFIKLYLFWLWLWQLKEYHLGRFIAHFREGQALRKILASFWWFKYPKFTSKIIVIFLTGLSLAVFLITKAHYLFAFLLIIVVPLLFQIPTVIWRRIYIRRAGKKRAGFKNLLTIGITGSYGKTSTKEFLAHILSKKFKVLKTKEHQNSEVGISRCILEELKPEHEVFVCEMGAYNRGGIKLLVSIAKPRIGVITGINEQHMATFGSQENIIKTKYELVESLSENGVAFFNGKNKYCVDLYEKTKIKKVLYGQNARFPGEENLLGAIAVAKEIGMSDEEIADAVKEIENVFPGVEIRKTKDGITVIDASYSANPDGVIAGLEYLRTFPALPVGETGLSTRQTGKKIIVMPCLIELGKAAKEVHKRIGAKIVEVCDLAIITTKDRFEDIKEGAGGSEKVLFIENPKEIVRKIKSIVSADDVVLLEGRVPSQVIKSLL